VRFHITADNPEIKGTPTTYRSLLINVASGSSTPTHRRHCPSNVLKFLSLLRQTAIPSSITNILSLYTPPKSAAEAVRPSPYTRGTNWPIIYAQALSKTINGSKFIYARVLKKSGNNQKTRDCASRKLTQHYTMEGLLVVK